jgi:hypothetical protein
MQAFWDWLSSLDWQIVVRQFIGSIIGLLIGVVVGRFVLFRRRLVELGKLQRGESDEILFQWHTLIPLNDSGDVVLAFRNVGPRSTVNSLYDNLAARDLLKRLSDRTTLMEPVLHTEGTVGFEVLNTALGYIAGYLAVSPFERDIWLFAMTCEDRQVVRKRCIRCFLIQPADLEKFLDWKWCSTRVRVEKPWHGLRIAALHRIALTWREEQDFMRQRRQSGGNGGAVMPLVDKQFRHERIRALSLGLNTREKYVGEPYTVDWSALLGRLKEMGLEVREG